MAQQDGIASPGDLIGNRFKVVRVLGKGGFGVVYHAQSLETGIELALKTYLSSAVDRKAIARFRQESEIWIALGAHPFLVQAYFVEEMEGRLYVGMEMIRPGPSLHNDLEGFIKSGRVDLPQILRWGVQICFGMEHAALRGIRSHRDLKPANIMINEKGQVKISDFGLATQSGTTDEERFDDEPGDAVMRVGTSHGDSSDFRGQTMRGIGFGTPTHMPPEQFEDAASCDARSDIYAVGVILYQLLTGELPVTIEWPTDSSLEGRLRFWRDMEQAHRSFRMPALASALDPILERCITPNPADRFQNFAKLRAALAQLLVETTGEEVPAPMMKPLTASEWISRGNGLLQLHRFDPALHAFNSALRVDPKSTKALNGRGKSLFQLGQSDLALESFDCVLATEPTSVSATNGRAECLHEQGALRAALATFDRALSIDSHYVPAWVGRSNLLMDLGDAEAAQKSIEKALELDPSHTDALSRKASLLCRKGDYYGGLELFEQALHGNPLHSGALRGQAITTMYTGRYLDAEHLIGSLDRSGELDDAVRIARAACLIARGEPQAAISDLDSVSDPHRRIDSARLRVSALVRLHRLKEAQEAVEWLHKQNASTFESSVQLLALKALNGWDTEALGHVGSMLESHPGNEATCAAAACAAIRSGLDHQAIQACDYALSYQSDSAALWYNRGIAQAIIGQAEEATKSFKTAADWWPASSGPQEDALYNAEIVGSLAGISDGSEGRSKSRSHTNRPTSAANGRMLLIPDGFASLDAMTTIRNQANGWAVRYRAPHLRPPYYLFPQNLPGDLAG